MDDPDKTGLTDRQARLRQDLGIAMRDVRGDMKQAELAEAIGVSPQAISNWERGAILPTLDNLLAVADAFNVPLSKFFHRFAATADDTPDVDADRRVLLLIRGLADADHEIAMALLRALIELRQRQGHR